MENPKSKMDDKQFVEANPCVRPATLFDYLSHYATTTPDKIALIDAATNRAINYRQLNESVFRLSSALSAFKIGEGTRIIAIIEKSVELVELILAASSVEALILHIPTDNHQLMLQQIQPHFQPDFIVIDEHVAVKQTLGKCLTYKELSRGGSRTTPICRQDLKQNELYVEASRWVVLTPESPLYVNYSSGSTGIPKLVIATQRHVIANTTAVASWFNFSSDDVHLCNFRSHAHEYFCFALCSGGTAVLLADFNNPRALFEALVHYQVTCLLANPATYISLISYMDAIQDGKTGRRERRSKRSSGRMGEGEKGRKDSVFSSFHPFSPSPHQFFQFRLPFFPSSRLNINLRLAICGGAATSELLRKRVFQALKTPLIEAWGSTETTGNVIANSPGRPFRPGSAGIPIRGYQVSIVREDGSLAATGEMGEVIIKGESIASGYLAAYSAKNARGDRLSDGKFSTGDIAYQDRDGFIFFQGRTDTKFKVGGHWVHPEVAERIFREDNRISDILITDVPLNSVWSQLPAAMVVLSKGAEVEGQKAIESRKQKAESRKRKAIDFSFLPSAFCLLPSATIPHSSTFSLLRRICKKAVRKVPDPIFSMPRYFLIVEALPKNAGGKISRQDAKTILISAVDQKQCLRIPLKLGWIIKSAWKPFGRWSLIKLLLSHPWHAVKMLREILSTTPP